MRRAFHGRPSASNSPSDPSSTTASSPSSGSAPDLQHIETVKTADATPTDTDKASELNHVDTKTSFMSLRKITSRKPKPKKEDPWKDWPENVYKPHEMPQLRYKRPADPKHRQHLEAYSLEKAFKGIGSKRRSRGSLYSPMGSRLPSRIGSIASRRSVAKTEGPSGSASVAEPSVQEDDMEGGGVENGKPHVAYACETRPVFWPPEFKSAPCCLENYRLTCKLLVGISRQNTRPDVTLNIDDNDQTSNLSTSRTAVPDLISSSSLDASSDDAGDISPSPLATSKTVTQGGSRAEAVNALPLSSHEPLPGKPFSEEELARALHKTAIATDNE